jgi:HK97 family phage prohead protease
MNKSLHIEAEVKALQEGEFEVIASTSDKDRMGDIVKVDGWELKNFKRNPVMLWAHDNYLPPIAKAMKIWTEDGKLMVKGKFASTPLGQEIAGLVKDGFINAVSVGFIPLKRADKGKKGHVEGENGENYIRATEEEVKGLEEKGFFGDEIFEKQELLEVSFVCVPALPQALITARNEGKSFGAIMSKAIETTEVKQFEEVVADLSKKDVDSDFDFVPASKVKSMIDEAVALAIRDVEVKKPVDVKEQPITSVETPVSVEKGLDNKAMLRLLRIAVKAIEAGIINVKKANQ